MPTSSVNNPWQRPVFVYSKVPSKQWSRFEKKVMDAYPEGWRYVACGEHEGYLGKIFDQVSLDTLEAVQAHIYSQLRAWGWGMEESIQELWVGPWLLEEDRLDERA